MVIFKISTTRIYIYTLKSDKKQSLLASKSSNKKYVLFTPLILKLDST